MAPSLPPQPSSSSDSSWGFWLVVLSGLFVLYAVFSPRPASLKKGTTLPSVQWERVSDGTPVKLDWKEGITILHFWATWCGACKAELNHASQRAQLLSQQGVRYFLVNLDRPSSSATLRNFLTQFQVFPQQFPFHLRDPRYDASALFQVSAFPSLVILNARGQVAFYVQGILPDSALLNLLKKVPPKV